MEQVKGMSRNRLQKCVLLRECEQGMWEQMGERGDINWSYIEEDFVYPSSRFGLDFENIGYVGIFSIKEIIMSDHG